MNLFGRTPSKADDYQTHLERVSRSFAFCIAELKSPLREWVGLSYLLCRIADTIEDSAWSSREDQDRAYADMLAILAHPEDRDRLNRFPRQFHCEMPAGERELLAAAPRLFADLAELPEPPRLFVRQTVVNMVRGMRFFSREKTDARGLHLHTTAELNQYCFFVAGVIGELLTGLANSVDSGFQMTEERLESSYHFGLFLQKVNILKDQRGDEAEGRQLVPNRADVEHGLLLHARRAMDYVLAIPSGLADFRLFCAWSLFLGLVSLPWIQRSWREARPLKISRLETFALLQKVRSIIRDEERLEALFREQVSSLRAQDGAFRGEATPGESSGEAPAWFSQSYEGKLGAAGLASLCLFENPGK